ncbi:IEC3 subunit of the Ino80 complex, chromatin re-modelling-domain-containing protein [Pyronema domesticum]|nr:IEC3 subunit of the Ino80 complex, chromatin re-modelling-domain-containing protein [Pyronema domesticum]
MDHTHAEDRAHQKSYKRKYRKLRHKFKEVMKSSDELFKQEKFARQALRRMQEENTRILDMLVDLNSSTHIPKERRHNIGSPSRGTPPRFMSPTLYKAIYGDIIPEDDIEELELDLAPSNGARTPRTKDVEKPAQAAEESSSDDDDEEDEDDKSPREDDEGSEVDDEEYKEEIRSFKYKKGIAGTPPRDVREQMKKDAMKKAEDEKAAKEKEKEKEKEEKAKEEKSNGTEAKPEVVVKEEEQDTAMAPAPEEEQKKLIVEEYERGRTPEYLRDCSPFLMTLEEEEEWYNEIHEKHNDGVPPLEHPESPSAAKAESDPRNPMSVYNWLRKNQPQVFLQGDEMEGKKPGRGRGGGRRKTITTIAVGDADSGDEGLRGQDPRLTGGKRRRTMTHGSETLAAPQITPGRGAGTGRGRGGRKKVDGGSPPAKRQRGAME